MIQDQIIQAASDASGVPVERIKSNDRKRDAVCARHVAMYLIRETTGDTFRKVAERFNHERSVCQHAHQYVADQLEVKQPDTSFILNQTQNLLNGIQSIHTIEEA